MISMLKYIVERTRMEGKRSLRKLSDQIIYIF